MDLVTVETFWSVEEAQLALGFLQSEEIPCRLESLAFASSFWYLANAAGGVKLIVPSHEAEHAVALLSAAHQHEMSENLDQIELETSHFDPGLMVDDVPDLNTVNEDGSDEDHVGLLERIRKFKPLAFLLVITGG